MASRRRPRRVRHRHHGGRVARLEASGARPARAAACAGLEERHLGRPHLVDGRRVGRHAHDRQPASASASERQANVTPPPTMTHPWRFCTDPRAAGVAGHGKGVAPEQFQVRPETGLRNQLSSRNAGGSSAQARYRHPDTRDRPPGTRRSVSITTTCHRRRRRLGAAARRAPARPARS
jgi:hypothetical protein